MSRFDECLSHILKFEGGFVDDPDDRGGATNYGITQKSFDAYRARHGFGAKVVKDMRVDEAGEVYRQDYWGACQCHELPIPLDLCVFDAAVQHGPARAIKWLQLAAGTQPDGIIGDKTLYAAKQFAVDHRVNQLVDAFMDTRQAFYIGILARDPSQRKFAHGWDNRMNELEKALA